MIGDGVDVFLSGGLRVKRVYKVKLVPRLYTFEQGVGLDYFNLVPAYVWYLEQFIFEPESHCFSRHQTEALLVAFLGAIEGDLRPDADAQDGDARFKCFYSSGIQPRFYQVFHRAGRRAYPGEDYFFGFSYCRRVAGYHRWRADLPAGAQHATYVPGAVVNYRNHFFSSSAIFSAYWSVMPAI
jgi:hypothetical protein